MFIRPMSRLIAVVVGFSVGSTFAFSAESSAFCEAIGKHGKYTHFKCSAYLIPIADQGALSRECCHCPNVLEYLKLKGVSNDCVGRVSLPPPPKVPDAQRVAVRDEITELKPILRLTTQQKDFALPTTLVRKLKSIPASPRCGCPRGFTEKTNSRGKTYCSSERTVEPIVKPVRVDFIQGDSDRSYYQDVQYLDHRNTTEAFSALPTGDGEVQFKSTSNRIKITKRKLDVARWRERSTASNMLIKGPEVNTWYTKAACIKTGRIRDYVVHLSADNEWALKIDGVKIGNCNSSCFLDGWFVNIKLDEGEHWVEFKFRNLDEGSPGMMFLDVFENSIDQLEKVSDFSKLKILYSTGNSKNRFFDYQGEVCPDGYAYDPCKTRKCRKIVNVACKFPKSAGLK